MRTWTTRIPALKGKEWVYLSLVVLFLLTVVVLWLMKQLFWLNLISTLLALVSGALSSLTKTIEEKDGHARLARAGRMLFGLCVLSGFIAVGTAYIQKEEDRRADRRKEAELEEQRHKIETLNSQLADATKDLKTANEKLDSQIEISLNQARALKGVASELHAERTPIHSAELLWTIWVKPKPDSECISELLRFSAEPFKEAEAGRPEAEKSTRGVTKKFADLGLLSERCRSEIGDTFGRQNLFVIHFFKSQTELRAMERRSFSQSDALEFEKGWTVRAFSPARYPAGEYYHWLQSRGLLVYQQTIALDQEQLKRPDGTSVSLFDLSKAGVLIRFDHGAVWSYFEDYGIETMVIVFNKWAPYGFGSRARCPKCIQFLSEEPAARSTTQGGASYKAVFPKIGQ